MELSKNKSILILTEWYLPGRKSGGPIKSIESLVWAMSNYFDFYILTTDTDLGEDSPYENIRRNEWLLQKDGSKIYYLEKLGLSKKNILQAIQSVEFEYLYLNSLYSKWFSIVPLRLCQNNEISCKVVLAPRGMLSEGALKIKPLKKKIFIFISRLMDLHRNISWHATSQLEDTEIRKNFGKSVKVSVVQNFSKPLKFKERNVNKVAGELKLFYLSRITKVKNLHLALETLNAFNNSDYQIMYDIYGQIEDVDYYQNCLKLIKKLNSNIKVEFKGEVNENNLVDIIPNYHFLFLPTSNENFGHSIYESLQCGVPVIISNKTPWRNLQEHGCGWDIESSKNNYYDVLYKCVKMDTNEYSKYFDCALVFSKKKSQDSEKILKMLELFR